MILPFVPVGGVTEYCQEGPGGQGNISAIQLMESISCLVGYYSSYLDDGNERLPKRVI